MNHVIPLHKRPDRVNYCVWALHCSSSSVERPGLKSYSLVLLTAGGISKRPTADDPSDLLARS